MNGFFIAGVSIVLFVVLVAVFRYAVNRVLRRKIKPGDQVFYYCVFKDSNGFAAVGSKKHAIVERVSEDRKSALVKTGTESMHSVAWRSVATLYFV